MSKVDRVKGDVNQDSMSVDGFKLKLKYYYSNEKNSLFYMSMLWHIVRI